MIGHMRHGSPPRLLALQSILSPNRRESLPTPSAGVRMIEQADTLGAQLGLSVWCEDEAGPFQAVPHPGPSWQPREHPAQQPHEYIRGGTSKILTLFHPATGQVRLQPAARCT